MECFFKDKLFENTNQQTHNDTYAPRFKKFYQCMRIEKEIVQQAKNQGNSHDDEYVLNA